METIRVRAEFHASHRLLRYDGKCAFVHGHTWRGSLVVGAEEFPRDEKLDLAVDFGAFKAIFKRLDHKMMVSAEDAVFLDPELFCPEGVLVIPGRNPTVENVASYCMDQAVQVLRESFPARQREYRLELTVQETDNNIYTLERTVAI